MAQFDPTNAEAPADMGRSSGPVDAILFETFPNTRLTELTMQTMRDGSLVVTAPERAGAVRLEASDLGLTAEQLTEAPDEELDAVEHIDPAPASEQFAGLNDLTRARGD